jgi:AcrR family transcriptional regulator
MHEQTAGGANPDRARAAVLDARREVLEARRRVWRDAALESAARLFAARGSRATSMKDVADDSGLALRALYQAFPSKDDLFVAVVDAAYARLLPSLTGDVDGPDAGERVLELIDRIFQSVQDRREAFLIHARRGDGAAATLRDGRDPFAPYVEMVHEQVARIVAGAQRAGYAPGIDPHVVAVALIATIERLCERELASDPEAEVTRLAPSVRALFAPQFSVASKRVECAPSD